MNCKTVPRKISSVVLKCTNVANFLAKTDIFYWFMGSCISILTQHFKIKLSYFSEIILNVII